MVMDHAELSVFADEQVGRHQRGAGHPLETGHERRRTEQVGDGPFANNGRRAAGLEHPPPAFHHRIPAAQHFPSWVHAGDLRLAGPDAVHPFRIGRGERAVERGVRGQRLLFVGHDGSIARISRNANASAAGYARGLPWTSNRSRTFIARTSARSRSAPPRSCARTASTPWSSIRGCPSSGPWWTIS